jgi:hypothetical protein
VSISVIYGSGTYVGGGGVGSSSAWHRTATPMKWTIRVELTPDGNAPITYEIGTITRPIADLDPEQIGLTREGGQQILPRVQVQMISSQAHAYALCRQPCLDCGRPRRVKDTRTKCVQAVFGAFRFRGRRYRACGCRTRPGDLHKISHSVKSFRGGQHRRCAPSAQGAPMKSQSSAAEISHVSAR